MSFGVFQAFTFSCFWKCLSSDHMSASRCRARARNGTSSGSIFPMIFSAFGSWSSNYGLGTMLICSRIMLSRSCRSGLSSLVFFLISF